MSGISNLLRRDSSWFVSRWCRLVSNGDYFSLIKMTKWATFKLTRKFFDINVFFSLTDCSFLFISFQTLGGRSELEQNGKMRRAILIDQDVAELQTCRGHEG